MTPKALMAPKGREVLGGGGRFGAVPAAWTIALVALGVCASTASAEPLSMTFTEGRANVGVQLSDAALFAAPDAAPFGAQIDGSGSITAGDLKVPQFFTHITAPIVADVTVDFEIGEIEGSFTQATGALTLQGEAGGILTAQSGTFTGEECIVSAVPSPLILTTAGNSGGASPRSGAPFIHGFTGAGAIAGQWTDMEAAPVNPVDPENVDFCNNVETRIGGPGGVWLKQEGDIVSPPAPLLTGTDPASPGGLSDTPRILGTAEAGSSVRIYAGADCPGVPAANAGAAELASPGLTVKVEIGTADFSATATDAAGNTSACSAPISYTRLHVDPPWPPPACIVPKLRGKTLARAKAALRAAYCQLGEVRKPTRLKSKGRRRLVVKSTNPAAGTTPADGKVNLRLGPRPRRARG